MQQEQPSSGVCMVCGDRLSINFTSPALLPSRLVEECCIRCTVDSILRSTANYESGTWQRFVIFPAKQFARSASLRNVLPSFHTLPHREMARSPCTVATFDLQLTSRDQGVFQKSNPLIKGKEERTSRHSKISDNFSPQKPHPSLLCCSHPMPLGYVCATWLPSR